MKLFVKTVLLLSFIVITTQDITGRKGCDCSICKGIDNKINPIFGKKTGNGEGGKSSCNLCEQKKEMLRLEKEKQRQLQKCPFELLGTPALKGKSSQEIFDEFRELIVPSQNGFFDMMRGIVRTMHFSSEAELKLAKEKEAMELLRKKKEEEEAKKRMESKHSRKEIVGLNNPIKNPKVTVVLKQTPCGQVIPSSEKVESEKLSLFKRLPKEVNTEINRIPEEEVLNLQTIEFGSNDQNDKDYLNLNSKENLLHTDLIHQLISYDTLASGPPQNEATGITEHEERISSFEEKNTFIQSPTESSFVDFLNNDELKAPLGGSDPRDDAEMSLNALTNMGVELQGMDKGNAQNVEYSISSALT